MAKEKIIELLNISKIYDGNPVVKNISLSIKRGEFVTLLGPSGCGKTTTLRMIAGFERPDSGQIFFNGKNISNVPPHKRNINTVFQKYALFPHLNVFNNIAFGLKIKKVPDGEPYEKDGVKYQNVRSLTKDEITTKVNKALEMVDLADFGYRHVDSLSGGQQQRVAIARALVNEPEVLLLDEPLGALDLKMRKDMQLELMSMHKKLGITFIYVTHDQEEALTMSDTIVVMDRGVIQQIGSPVKIYDEPANIFVADFIGESNIYTGIMNKDYVVSFLGKQFTCVDKGFKYDEPIDVIIRPEDIKVVSADDKKCLMCVEVLSSVFKGNYYQTTCLTCDEDTYGDRNEILVHDNVECTVGEIIGLYIKPFDLHIMRKSRVVNKLITHMEDNFVVDICGGKFECMADLPADTPVEVEVEFDDVLIIDDENDGTICAEVVESIYKGSYYLCILRTDDYYEFFVDTLDEWNKGDRVGININADKIKITPIEVNDEQE
ncbi:MAG: ABC transporter ATP-binding protein [Clostridia bacterium]|nr:ABC transporter ATP-binding protein [Clostridia bacterium]